MKFCPECEAEAAALLLKAAEQGCAEAQFELGECYYYGYGIDENEAEGIKWYRKAVEQGNYSAKSWLKEHGY